VQRYNIARAKYARGKKSGFSRRLIVGVSRLIGTSRRFAKHAFGTEPAARGAAFLGGFASLTLIGVGDVDDFGAAQLELIAAGSTAEAAEQSATIISRWPRRITSWSIPMLLNSFHGGMAILGTAKRSLVSTSRTEESGKDSIGYRLCDRHFVL
jgi:hypothetical protein